MDRARHRCEYCHLPVRGQVATFPLDHIIPRHAGGLAVFENLALSCPHCNAHKWTATEALDVESNVVVNLFHPRQDLWNEHFDWQWTTGELLGKSDTGRATISSLQINAADMVELRLLLNELGLFPSLQA